MTLVRVRRVALLATVVASALAGCQSSTHTSTSPTRPRATTTTNGGAASGSPAGARPSKGCASPAGPATAGDVTVGGVSRHYLLALPSDLHAPAPVVVDLHGLGESAEAQAQYSKLGPAGTAAGMIVATPASDNPQNSWALPVLDKKDSDFVGALLDQLEATRCVDTTREVAAGISNGAGLSVGLVCGLGGRLAAIFPVAGVNILRPCAAAKPTTIVAFHGTADALIPYAGGKVFSGVDPNSPVGRRLQQLQRGADSVLRRITLQPVETAVGGWASIFQCGAPTDHDVATGVRLRTYTSCAGGANVELYTIAGGGHTWPGASDVGTTRGLGATTHAISATDVIVRTVLTLTTRR